MDGPQTKLGYDKCIFRYFKGKTNIGLVYPGDTSYALVAYWDSDYAINLDARQTMVGYALITGNSLVRWKATLQPIVALSTIEAVYMALSKALKEAI